jgi:hypothetical protein
MDLFLYNDVAAPLGMWIVLPRDKDKVWNVQAHGVRGAVNKTEEIAGVKVAEPNYLVDELHRVTEAVHELMLELETDIAALGADVKEEISRGGDGGV